MKSLLQDVRNWRTTAVGWISGLILCLTQILYLLDNDLETVFEMPLFLAGIAMLGLGTFAKDGDKSSEDVRSE